MTKKGPIWCQGTTVVSFYSKALFFRLLAFSLVPAMHGLWIEKWQQSVVSLDIIRHVTKWKGDLFGDLPNYPFSSPNTFEVNWFKDTFLASSFFQLTTDTKIYKCLLKVGFSCCWRNKGFFCLWQLPGSIHASSSKPKDSKKGKKCWRMCLTGRQNKTKR